MQSLFAKLNPQALSVVLSAVQSNQNCVIYLVDPTYQKQFYLSPSYEVIWGRPTEPLYQDMSIWQTTVHDQDLERVTNDMNLQFQNGEIPLNNLCYRIQKPEGDSRYLKCSSFPLYNDNNICTAIVGIIESIAEDHYNNLMIESNGGTLNNAEDELTKKILQLTQTEWGFSDKAKIKPASEIPYDGKAVKKYHYLKIDERNVKLSVREIQCVACLKLGLTAKQTADRLNISYRTVERHFENIKAKLDCRNKYTLIHKLMKVAIPEL